MAWKVEHGKIPSTEGGEIFYGQPPGLRYERFVRPHLLSEACTLGEQETEALDEVDSIQVARLFFSSREDFPIPALLDPCLLVFAKHIAPRLLPIACQVIFRRFEP